MKKLAFGFSIFLLPLCLTSCEVHWFSKKYDVPWWWIAIPTLLFFFCICFFAGKRISKKEYVCPICQKTFYPKWWQAAFSIHVNEDRVFKCPCCGRKGFCKPSNG